MSDYRWEASGPVDPDVADLEARLEPLAFDPKTHPFTTDAAPRAGTGADTAGGPGLGEPHAPERRPPWRRRASALSSLAACLLLCAGLYALHVWRLDWRAGEPWPIEGRSAALAVGAPLDVDGADARIDVARLGVLSAAPGTHLELLTTGPTRHRLSVTRGQIHMRLWAPPGRVTLRTPAGDVIDLGCIFTLAVDGDVARLQVQTGWVDLQNAHGNSFVPAGASAAMSAGAEPGVPVYDDAVDEFREAVRRLEKSPDLSGANTLRAVTFDARPRDVVTLLALSDRSGMPSLLRAALLERASVLSPAPSADAIARILAGDRDLFWKWYDSLPLPSLKNWWHNWRDAFPR